MEYNREKDGKFAPKGTGDRTEGESAFERGFSKAVNADRIAELRKAIENAPSALKRAVLRSELKQLTKEHTDEPKQQPVAKPVAKAAEKRKEPQEDYMMSHRPTESGITADDLADQSNEIAMPKDIYDNLSNYASEEGSEETIRALKEVRGKPDATITIYRATTGDSINDGDWVTLSRKYAEMHNAGPLKGKGKIISMKVPVKDIQFPGDSLNEWGYFPNKRR